MTNENQENLTQKIEDLEKLIHEMLGSNQDHFKKNTDDSRKYLGWLQSIIAIVVVIVGLGVTWGITTTKLSVMEATQQEQKRQYHADISKLQANVHELQLKQAKDDQLLITIKEDVGEIKKSLQALAERIP